MLVGREREIQTLDELLRRAELGDRSVAVITGEPGIGKTRLLDALATRVRALGGRVAWGRTAEVGRTPAFWPWLQMLAALETPDDRAPALDSVDDNAVSATRLVRFAEVAAFLGRRAAAPIALLFDDMHAADPSSLQLLEYVLPMLAGQRVLVAIAARDGDATPEIAAGIGRLQRLARRVALPRLSRSQVGELVAGRGDAAQIFALSEGNPLFVEELVAAGEGEGTLRLPALSSVRAVIRERVARLPEATGRALVAAAVIGREQAGRVLAEMLDGADVGAVLAPAVKLGMIAAVGPDRFQFSHALFAETIVDELDTSERARLHLRAAHAIERHAKSDRATIAHHLLAAGHLAAEAAVIAAEAAAREEMQRLAFEDAAALLARAEDALALAAPDDARRARLMCARAEALQHAGSHAQGNALCERAAQIARTIGTRDEVARRDEVADRDEVARNGDGELFAQIALVRGIELRFGATDQTLVEMLREALERISARPSAIRARLLARLAGAMQPAADPAEPVARAWEAIAMAREVAGDRERLAAMYTATSALVDYVSPEQLAPLHAEVLELARRLGDRPIIVHTMLRRCFVALERTDRAAFEEESRAFSDLATELSIAKWTRVVPMLAALTALLDGRFADAARASELGAERAAGDEHALLLVDLHRYIADVAATRRPRFDLARFEPLVGPGRNPLTALHAALQDRFDEARAEIDAIGGAKLDDPNFIGMFVVATALVKDVATAAVQYARLRDRSGRIVLASMVGFAVQDLFDRMLLLLADVVGDHDAIDAHAEAALAVATRLGSPPWIARVRADYACALAHRARVGDAERAAELWTIALAEARRLDMPGVVAQCEAGLGGAPAIAPIRAAAGVAIAKSGELWLVEGAGERHHIRDSRGMQMLAMLVAAPNREHHALDLAGAFDGVDGGDAGGALDATARARYRERVAELTAERDRAEGWNDAARAARATAELEALTAELSRAFGLGGRERKVGAAAERARTNVQRRIQHALQQIRAVSPRIGEHLDACVRTGMTCVYAPRS